ncbi:MAG: D-alanine--D-alanine ligase [Firmicutes bacterium]|nr:D-alanine--D-alanine ligase [Bacillota bacterium]
MDKKNIAIIFGGHSAEHYVSCMSAANVIANIDTEKYNIEKLGITEDGQWILTQATAEEIHDGKKWLTREDNKTAFISPVRDAKTLYVFEDGNVCEKKIDGVFCVIHGTDGEDGKVQGILELANIPYVGCGIASSAIAYDKVLTKDIVATTGIHQADFWIVREQNYESADLDRIDAYFDHIYPLFVKPARAGSSVGVSKVTCKEELEAAIATGFTVDSKLLIEKGIVGRELEIAVLGTKDPKASSIGEILAHGEFYTYDSKYNDNESRTRVVDDISPEIAEAMKEAALKIYQRLECEGLSRVDFFLQPNGTYVFNEINTLPGFTSISMYSQLWEHDGISYRDLITCLIEDAFANPKRY